MANPSPWKFSEHSRNVHSFHVTLPKVGAEQYFLLQSDVHFDNPHCKLELLRGHLEEAKRRNAPVLDAGDFFCAMQGKYDPRASKNDLRPEHQSGSYLDKLVSTAADFLHPFRHLLTLRAHGNHETGILKRAETDLTERLVERLKASGSPACSGKYSGWVRFYVKHGGTRSKSFDLWYHHGYGGGGPVTRGTIQTARTAVYVADADFVWMGHTHDAWTMPIEKIRLNAANRVEAFRQHHVRTPGYKDEYADGASGWHIERGGAPKPTGAAWLRLYLHADGDVRAEIREAV